MASLEEKLIQAVHDGDAEAVDDLLAQGASPDTVDEDDEPLSLIAIADDHVAVVDALCRGGCSLEPWSALLSVRGEAMLRCLLGHGVEIDASDVDDRSTALYGMKSATLVEAFLDAGADPNRATANHETPLTFHASWGNLEVVERLLAHGADPNYVDPETMLSVLDYAASHGNRNIVETLVDGGAALHRANEGTSAVTLALRGGHLGIAELLLSRGAKLGERDYEELKLLAERVAELSRRGDGAPLSPKSPG